MMDSYLQRLENIISPNTYSLNNYREKIFNKTSHDNRKTLISQGNFNNNITGINNFNYSSPNNNFTSFTNTNANGNTFQNDFGQNTLNKNNMMTFNNLNSNNMNSKSIEFQLNLDKNNINSEENKKLIEEYIQRMGIKDLMESASSNPNILNESKLRIYQKILEKEGKLENPEDIINTYSQNEILNPAAADFQNNLELLNNQNNNNYHGNINNVFNNHNTNPSTLNANMNLNSNNNNLHSLSINNFNNPNDISIANSKKENSRLNNSNNVSKNLSLSPSRKYKQMMSENVNTEREKIHLLNIKAMNYRHEVETLKKRICELNKTIEDQKEKILRMEKQKENDNKYLLKLENMLAAKSSGQPSLHAFLNNSVNVNNMSSLSNLSQRNFTNGLYVELKKCTNLIIQDKVNDFSMNLTDQNEMKDFILNLMNEAQKLKAFQKQVFDISRSYDDINDNIINSIKTIQNLMEISSVKTFDEMQKKEIYCKHIIFFLLSSFKIH